jgi:hypothetical protein
MYWGFVAVFDLLPRDLPVQFPEVRPEGAREDLEGGGLPDAVRAEEAGHLPLHRDGEAVEGKGVLPVPVGGVGELLGEAHDIDGEKGAFLDADPAADAELLGDEGLPLLPDDHRLVTGPDPGAVEDALGPALLRVAAVPVDDGDPHGGQREERRMVQVMNQKARVMKPWKSQSFEVRLR